MRTNVIVLTLASRSAGVVTRRELLEAGLSSSTISARVSQGFLSAVWPGLYEVPEMANQHTPLFRAVKSVTGSALSHQSAGWVWEAPLGLSKLDESVHVTAARNGTRTDMPGVVRHRTRRPFEEDIRYPIDGLPVLSPARTILDLAGEPTIGNRRLSHIVETQITAGRVQPDELSGLLLRPGLRGVSGARRLRAVVDNLLDDEPVADSMLERLFVQVLADHGIGGFRRQVAVPWYDGRRGVVDFANVSTELIVEVDGRRWHATGQAMTEDRRRDRLAATHGWQVLRVTWEDLVEQPTRTAEQVAAAVTSRRRRCRGPSETTAA
ncbi:MAG: DUF559 domain-containing protein [Acidimicrobiia bacterium]|nr:DUF559 domain-containing protein [Acidimicrobiia bacterium]